MILTILICWCFLVFSGECVVYKSAKIGGDGGGKYDDLLDNNLLDGQPIFRLVNVLLWGRDYDYYGPHGIQGKYAILNGTSPQTLDGHLFRGSVDHRDPGNESDARFQLALSGREIIEKMYGYYRSHRFVDGTYLLNSLAFDVRRANGTIQYYGVGRKQGANFTVLGPIVGFYGGVGHLIDSIGAYVDPSLWPDRPSRLVMGPTGGRRYGNGEDDSFDHNIKLREPFVTRIAELVIFYSNSSGVNGMSVVYEDNLRNSSTISSGSTGGKNVTVIFELGDYIKVLEVNSADGQVSRDFCLAGLQITVFRAGREVNETISVGTINSTGSTTVRTDGPVVAFYGLIQGSYPSCIARLGGYRLLQSSELNRTCSVPKFPCCTLLGETPQQIFTNHVLAFACGNSGITDKTDCGATLVQCREDGIWEELDNRDMCIETPQQSSVSALAAGITGVVVGSLIFIALAFAIGFGLGRCVHFRKESKQTRAVVYSRGSETNAQPLPIKAEVHSNNLEKDNSLFQQPTGDDFNSIPEGDKAYLVVDP